MCKDLCKAECKWRSDRLDHANERVGQLEQSGLIEAPYPILSIFPDWFGCPCAVRDRFAPNSRHWSLTPDALKAGINIAHAIWPRRWTVLTGSYWSGRTVSGRLFTCRSSHGLGPLCHLFGLNLLFWGQGLV